MDIIEFRYNPKNRNRRFMFNYSRTYLPFGLSLINVVFLTVCLIKDKLGGLIFILPLVCINLYVFYRRSILPLSIILDKEKLQLTITTINGKKYKEEIKYISFAMGRVGYYTKEIQALHFRKKTFYNIHVVEGIGVLTEYISKNCKERLF